MTKVMFCLAVLLGIFVGIGLTVFALWLWDNEVYPDELEEDEE